MHREREGRGPDSQTGKCGKLWQSGESEATPLASQNPPHWPVRTSSRRSKAEMANASLKYLNLLSPRPGGRNSFCLFHVHISAPPPSKCRPTDSRIPTPDRLDLLYYHERSKKQLYLLPCPSFECHSSFSPWAAPSPVARALVVLPMLTEVWY